MFSWVASAALGMSVLIIIVLPVIIVTVIPETGIGIVLKLFTI
jgi:hypothetical protein